MLGNQYYPLSILYHTKLFFEKITDIPDWSKEKYQRYKAKTLNLNTVVYERFKQITEENVVDTFNNCYVINSELIKEMNMLFSSHNILYLLSTPSIADARVLHLLSMLSAEFGILHV